MNDMPDGTYVIHRHLCIVHWCRKTKPLGIINVSSKMSVVTPDDLLLNTNPLMAGIRTAYICCAGVAWITGYGITELIVMNGHAQNSFNLKTINVRLADARATVQRIQWQHRCVTLIHCNGTAFRKIALNAPVLCYWFHCIITWLWPIRDQFRYFTSITAIENRLASVL